MTLLELSEERASVEDAADVIEGDDEHQADEHDEAHEVNEPFLFRRDSAAADQLDQDEEQPCPVECRDGKKVEECEVE